MPTTRLGPYSVALTEMQPTDDGRGQANEDLANLLIIVDDPYLTATALAVERAWDNCGHDPNVMVDALRMILLHHEGDGSRRSDKIEQACEQLREALKKQ